MKIEVWSDIVCPWCYIGKRRLEAAIAEFDEPVEVEWRSFELDPRAPDKLDGPLVDALARKYRVPSAHAQQMMDRVVGVAAQEGLEMNFDAARTGNTFDAHRLIHHARAHGLAGEMKERLMQAYFTDGVLISDADALIELAGEVGLDPSKTRAMLDSDAHADAVRAEESAAHSMGAHGVPFFRIDGKFGVSGAQEASTLLLVFEQVRERRDAVVADGSVCDDDGCIA